ncbi:N-acetylmuramic acid 6-phosphate etherase [Pseudogracilibacillus auburnensis]|uniref:N-acetylmuramic acid 6-phosphate etherase n=1 Tax=Pseudogracilibacillus auburnensis TaxID=1494959 RepID=A0A2V3WAE2_9BACI|nr:N-acetylmuramic acid 6-phosphate etherase [Pseudogracilibacillus auburnensis]MBO1001974.1 N-acetylmuramic acid 6-phosphate etherase [Pseudogracilibacillus auburnensis]PXW90198.1 N-acetylmuramic acid 6-phosphate etherase [Pseudogracilibacillus auburnensis]
MVKLKTLTTEQRNIHSKNIDNLSTSEILHVINNEDVQVAQSVKKVLPNIEQAIDKICDAMSKGGKLFYIGAGTSGRIGILDAVECPPTFSTPPDLVQAIIAGGLDAFMTATEGAEDDEARGANDLEERELTSLDVVVGIAASGRTPYVLGALQFAREIGATTVSVSSNEQSLIGQNADITIDVDTGPEVLTGSTRMKAATAQKLILNMITTTTMIKIGKVYENLMVDVKVSNYKLKERAKSIISTITSVSSDRAEEILEEANLEVKPAIVMIKAKVNYEKAKQLIEESNGFVRKAIELANS